MKNEKNKWSRNEKIALIGVIISFISVIVTTLPEAKRMFFSGMDNNSSKKPAERATLKVPPKIENNGSGSNRLPKDSEFPQKEKKTDLPTDSAHYQNNIVTITAEYPLREIDSPFSAALCRLRPSDQIEPESIVFIEENRWCKVRIVSSLNCNVNEIGLVPLDWIPGKCKVLN